MPPNPQNMAQQSPGMSPQDAKASLGISTRLVEELLASQNPNPQPMETEEPQEEAGEERMRAIVQEELQTFKEELLNLLQPNEAEPTE